MRRDDQRLRDILEALDWIARAVAGKAEVGKPALEHESAAADKRKDTGYIRVTEPTTIFRSIS
jgi:hypothetical protein